MSNQSQHNEVRNSVRQILDEIDRDMDAMDVDRIDTLVRQLEPAPNEENVEAMLRRIERRVEAEKRSSTTKSFFRHAALACACLIVVCTLLFGAEEAFRWETLLQFIRPLTDVLVYGRPHGEQMQERGMTESNGEEGVSTVSTIVESDLESGLYEAFPNEKKAFETLLAKYALTQMSVFEDEEMRFATLTLEADGKEVYVQIQSFSNDELLTNALVEYSREKLREISINGVAVSVYQNVDDYSCSWVDLLASYNVWNAASEDIAIELASILIGG